MKIGFDGKRAIGNMTGLGNYSRLVIDALSERFPSDEFIVYAPDWRENPRLKYIRERSNISFHLPAEEQGMHNPEAPASKGNRLRHFKKGSIINRGFVWRTWGLTRQLRRDGIELFHGLSNELPLNILSANLPTVVTIHDLIYRRLPYCYKPIDRILYDYKYGESARQATRIIAVSERTKKDIIELYDVPEERIDVVYQGCDDSFRKDISPRELNDVRKRYQLPMRYLLQVGTIERRKNLELSVKALKGLPESIELVAVGRKTAYYDKVLQLARRLGVDHRLRVLDKVPFADLPALNRRAEIILYPSRYEGFGIPVIEGLESSRPVVAATGSCLEEAGGDGAWYVGPDDDRGLTELLRSMIEGNVDTAGKIAAGKRYIKRFDNSNMADNISKVYRAAIRDFNSSSLP